VVLLLAGALAAGLAGCGRSTSSRSSSGGGGPGFQVVAAENFWGSIAAQIAGEKAAVTSVIVNPNTDPHSYEPSAQDARTMAGANMAIVNGIGYDNWAPRLLGASPLDGRVVLNVGELLGFEEGANPHRWYSPLDVDTVIGRIVTDYERLDPVDAAYFAQRARRLLGQGFARYDSLRHEIRARFSGLPVGYSESIFQPLGEDLGLKLLTPSSFTKAIAEGVDVTAADKEIVDAQARQHQIRVWILNSQNVTPDVKRVTQIAGEQHIPTVSITETLSPPSDTFEQWQVSQLERILAALRQATGAAVPTPTAPRSSG
jgi:zinc/manganese transport system substrate-binding protein